MPEWWTSGFTVVKISMSSHFGENVDKKEGFLLPKPFRHKTLRAI